MRMEPLDNVVPQDRNLQREHNVAAYAMYGTGTRCRFADQIADERDVVHCDWGEPGQGIRDFPMDPIPIYPRIFGTMGVYGYYSYPLASYWDNPGNASLFSGIYSYSSDGRIAINKLGASIDGDPALLDLIKEFGAKDGI